MCLRLGQCGVWKLWEVEGSDSEDNGEGLVLGKEKSREGKGERDGPSKCQFPGRLEEGVRFRRGACRLGRRGWRAL